MLPSGRGRSLAALGSVLAFVLPAVVSWAFIGFLIQFAPTMQRVLLVSALGYGLAYGTVEALGIWRPSPGLQWQVPARWLRRRSQGIRWVVWGLTLGPGFLTRNPYASFWLLIPLGSLYGHWLLWTAMGATHGAARAIGIVHNMRCSAHGASVSDWARMPALRKLDGLATLSCVGILAVGTFRLA